MAKSKQDRLTGKQKAAILMISLGLDVSASVYKHLTDEEIERLTLEISNVRSVSPEKKMISSRNFMKRLSLRNIFHKAGFTMQSRCLIKRSVKTKPPTLSTGLHHHFKSGRLILPEKQTLSRS